MCGVSGISEVSLEMGIHSIIESHAKIIVFSHTWVTEDVLSVLARVSRAAFNTSETAKSTAVCPCMFLLT